MLERVILNIEDELIILDTIFKKYVEVPSNLIFIKNNRYPLMDKQNLHKYTKQNIVSSEPWHPFVCIECMKDLLTLYIYSNSENKQLFMSNPLMPVSKSFISTFNTDEQDIVVEHLPNIVRGDFDEVIRIFRRLYDKIKIYTDGYVDNIFEFETNTGYIVLLNLGDIHAYRFKEYIAHKEYN